MKCPKCESKNIIMIEYYAPDTLRFTPSEAIYDGISEIQCQDCGTRSGRWSLRELKDGELERRYGGKPVKLKLKD